MRGSILFLALALGACTVGPDYHRPPTPGEAGGWMDGNNGAPPDADPWARLDDPELRHLIARALAANPDIRVAEARLREARAQHAGAVAQGLPGGAATASAQRMELSENGELPLGSLPGFERRFPLYELGFDASWELDLWGANRRAVEAAGHQAEAAAADARGVRLAVAAEVVRAYAGLRAAQAGLADARTESEARHTMAGLAAELYHSGEVPGGDEANARARDRATRAAVPGLEARVREGVNTLAVLTGNPPEALLPELSAPMPLPEAPDYVPLGLRSEVLRRRPDVRAAEAGLAAATAGIGVAVADLFPRFSLAGGLDQQSREFGPLTAGGSTSYQVGPALSWPIFDAAQIRANIHAARARADAAAAAYTRTVLTALAESETAANAYVAARDTTRERGAARAATATALARSQERWQAGEDNHLDLLETQAALLDADAALVQAREQQLIAYAALIKALGGGADRELSPPDHGAGHARR